VYLSQLPRRASSLSEVAAPNPAIVAIETVGGSISLLMIGTRFFLSEGPVRDILTAVGTSLFAGVTLHAIWRHLKNR